MNCGNNVIRFTPLNPVSGANRRSYCALGVLPRFARGICAQACRLSAGRSLSRWAMRLVLVVYVLLACALARADLDYFESRKWIERKCVMTNAQERLFLGHMESPRFATIIHLHKGISLREIIDHT